MPDVDKRMEGVEQKHTNCCIYELRRVVSSVANAVLFPVVIAGSVYLGLSIMRVPVDVKIGNVQIDNRKTIASIDSLLERDSSPSKSLTTKTQSEYDALLESAREIPDIVPSEEYGLMYSSGGTLKCIYPNGRRHSDYRYVEHIINGRKVGIPVEELRNTGPTSVKSPNF